MQGPGTMFHVTEGLGACSIFHVIPSLLPYKEQSFKNGIIVNVTLSCYLICFCLKILPNQSVSLGLPDGAYTEKLFLNSNISMATFKKLYCYWEHLLGSGEAIW